MSIGTLVKKAGDIIQGVLGVLFAIGFIFLIIQDVQQRGMDSFAAGLFIGFPLLIIHAAIDFLDHFLILIPVILMIEVAASRWFKVTQGPHLFLVRAYSLLGMAAIAHWEVTPSLSHALYLLQKNSV